MQTSVTICQKYMEIYESEFPDEKNHKTANQFLYKYKEAIMNDLAQLTQDPVDHDDSPRDIQLKMAFQYIVDEIKNGFGMGNDGFTD